MYINVDRKKPPSWGSLLVGWIQKKGGKDELKQMNVHLTLCIEQTLTLNQRLHPLGNWIFLAVSLSFASATMGAPSRCCMPFEERSFTLIC